MSQTWFCVARFVAVCLACATVESSSLHGQSNKAAATPPSFDVLEKTVEELQQAMQAGKVTSRQLVDAYLLRIEAYDKQGPSLNAIVTTNPDARKSADGLDAERATRGPRGPLHGIPILVKDNYETIEMPTSVGSIALASFHPKRDAVQIQRLKAAGAVILGKTNMQELAQGIVTVGSRFGYSKNPYHLDRNPGGSSGGTGAAIAANFAVAGMGSDTCGSIRIPASHNNLVGLRGTQGLSSRSGIVPLSVTQDIGGPLARSIADLAIMLDATVGVDAADPSTSLSAGHIPASYRAALRADVINRTRIGVLRTLFGSTPEDAEVTAVVQRTLEQLKKSGAEIIDVVVPGLDDLLRDSSMIPYDFKFDFAEYLSRSEGAPVKSLGEILDRGLFHSALEPTFRTRNAIEQRETDASRRVRIKQTTLRQVVEATLAEYQLTALVYPTIRRKPARLGDAQPGTNCQISSHSGLPALNVPAGFTDDGLPIGMDLLAGSFKEQELLSLGFSIEGTLKLRRAPFSTPALVSGKRPPARKTTIALRPASSPATSTVPGGSISFDFDETMSQLSYTVQLDPAGRDRIAAIWIHGGTSVKPGAARHLIYSPDQTTTGRLLLSSADRKDLAGENMLVRVYVTGSTGSAADVPLVFR